MCHGAFLCLGTVHMLETQEQMTESLVYHGVFLCSVPVCTLETQEQVIGSCICLGIFLFLVSTHNSRNTRTGDWNLGFVMVYSYVWYLCAHLKHKNR